MYLIKTPGLLKKLYPSLIWDVKPAARSIFLTFDDGPIPIVTPFVLKNLEAYKAKATFFCIGDNVTRHPDVYNEVKNAGHAIGNHTYNHLRGWDTDSETYLDNFLKADYLMQSALFRPPYGRIKREQIKMLRDSRPGLKIIMWDVLSGDFDTNLDPEECLRKVIKYTKPGSIIVFHDSLKAFKRLEYVLPRALEYWSKAGYNFEALTL
ncbi:polysaccharide deacetylase family protein [Mucilaginibacter terrenus]|uniref:Polysaccharide deacetylase family protein n=1 Tax=Mucilaginibacter terrenus TaxID=2482727 RepID=A0A3E2NQR5_9SPHI|nr:polysaccharide deacetylase family protein [Mucilaginibacter terrenus]RFZ83281.1 polysaccharide deacetylase family protein [Mucilaginibacter terrenus]